MTQKDPSATSAGGDKKPGASPSPAAPTVSHLLGEMTWLVAQSPLHNVLAIRDLEWLVMPALIHRQFYLFRDGEQPVGLALWARCTPEAATKLDRGLLEPGNRLTLEEWASGDQVWLVDLIAPHATPDNRQREIMLADLISGPLAGCEFRFHQTDEVTGRRVVRTVAADAGEQLKRAVELALNDQDRGG